VFPVGQHSQQTPNIFHWGARLSATSGSAETPAHGRLNQLPCSAALSLILSCLVVHYDHDNAIHVTGRPMDFAFIFTCRLTAHVSTVSRAPSVCLDTVCEITVNYLRYAAAYVTAWDAWNQRPSAASFSPPARFLQRVSI